ncbi:ribonuclease J [Frigidibacter sp. ROC022]|uniref:ribonuclease J n=1 Tax=Frigidibacter sp. ROC022 TaxID=2971796 RepID=UPI00215B32C4|nr:ribonuclease J [Frigidibacter sp. ROC022]MCR8723293.1 ribonuclease J [Frigidibacter sp. ROC022]
MTAERLIYLPLGGAGEVGMNLYVYGYGKKGRERLIVVDLGVTFPDMDSSPGVDLIMADIKWLAQRADRIEAVFITHAHEDHIGALPLLLPQIEAPVYARRFTGHLGALKLSEAGLATDVLKITEAWPETVTAGPFKVGFLPISHSIPESAGLVIDTPAGRIVHTGDFKIDRTPGVGEAFDDDLWASIAAPGVRALVCDSTNVFQPAAGRSEADIADNLERLIAGASGMLAATTFASNVARLKTLAEAGKRAGREIVLLGRAMRRMVDAATETGVLTDFPRVLQPEEAADVPRDHLMLLTTGSQGERRAASAALSRGKYLGLELKEGDTFLFSSKTIPGNERGVLRIMNNFSERGVEVVDDNGGAYHVSGHANRPDLAFMHRLMKPKMLVPMHGEHRMLREHANLGEEAGIPSVIATNGMMVDLSGDRPEIVERIDPGRTYLDGSVLIGAMDGVVRDRIRMALNGHVVVTVIIDESDEVLGDAWCDTMGLPELGRSNAPLLDVLEEDLSQFLGRADAKTLRNDDKLEDNLRRIARQSAANEIGKKPEVSVVISRLSA